MSKKQSENDQPGPQQHAEGQQGEKAHQAFIESLHGKHGGSEESEGAPQDGGDVDAFGRPHAGRHRLTEDREQHDEGEKNSEFNRLRG